MHAVQCTPLIVYYMGKYLCYCIHKKILSRKIIPKITRVRPSEQKLQGRNIFLKIYFNFLLAGERENLG